MMKPQPLDDLNHMMDIVAHRFLRNHAYKQDMLKQEQVDQLSNTIRLVR